jgi:hypothetical protein
MIWTSIPSHLGAHTRKLAHSPLRHLAPSGVRVIASCSEYISIAWQFCSFFFNLHFWTLPCQCLAKPLSRSTLDRAHCAFVACLRTRSQLRGVLRPRRSTLGCDSGPERCAGKNHLVIRLARAFRYCFPSIIRSQRIFCAQPAEETHKGQTGGGKRVFYVAWPSSPGWPAGTKVASAGFSSSPLEANRRLARHQGALSCQLFVEGLVAIEKLALPSTLPFMFLLGILRVEHLTADRALKQPEVRCVFFHNHLCSLPGASLWTAITIRT